MVISKVNHMNLVKRELNSIMFNNQQKFIIPLSTDSVYPLTNNIQAVLTINRNLESFGYTLDTEILEQLSKFSIDDLTYIYNDIIDIIKEKIGINEFTKTNLFYSNFPDEVMDKSESELYFNSLLYYTFSQTDDVRDKIIASYIKDTVSDVPQKRLPLLNKFPTNLKIITSASYNDLYKMMDDRIHSLNMSESQLKELFVFQKYCPSDFNQILKSDRPFQSKHNIVLLMKTMYKLSMVDKDNNNEIKFKDQILSLSKDSKDVVKFAAALSIINLENKNKWPSYKAPFDEDLRNGLPIFCLKPAEQRLIKEMLNQCPNIYYDIWRKNDKVLYERLRNRINPTKGPKRIVKLFDNLSNNQKIDEKGNQIKAIYRKLDDAIENIYDPQARKSLNYLVTNFQGAFLSNYISYIEKVNSIYPEYAEYVIKAAKLCDKVPVYAKIKLQNLIAKRDSFGDIRYNKDGHGNIRTITNTPLQMSYEQKNMAIEAIQQSIDIQTSDTMKLGKVFIDSELKNRIAPAREMKDCSEGPMLVPGSTKDMNDKKNMLIFAINWKEYTLKEDLYEGKTKIASKGDSIRADIDLHAKFLTEDLNEINEIYYGYLKTPYGCLSGDFTTATYLGDENLVNNATEAIAVDKSKLPEDCRYIAVSVVGFNIPFNLAEEVRFITQEREGSLRNFKAESIINSDKICTKTFSMNGEVFEASEIENPIKINAPVRCETPCLYDIKENKMIWLDMPEINPFTYTDINLKYEIWKKDNEIRPTMYQLFMNYAMNNGDCIVDDIKLADTIFTADNIDRQKEEILDSAKIISSYELDNISANFSGNPQKLYCKDINREDEIEISSISKNKNIAESPSKKSQAQLNKQKSEELIR